jgi:tetratricopeptide (TPR) repeat protein
MIMTADAVGQENPEQTKAKVFISYSRKDTDFVRRLDESLKSLGRDTWVDWEDIRPTEEWMQAIYRAIEGADTFVFVLSPDSIASEVCGREIALAAEHNKRMVPIVAREVNAQAVPESLAKLNWIFCRESDVFEKATDDLISALDTDLEWIHAHTRLLTRAIEWENKGQNNSFVLRGDDLRSAEQWLAQAGADKERRPTALQTEYIIASRKAAARRQRITLGAVTFGLVVAIILAIVAVFARQEAVKQRAKAVAGRNRADDVINFVKGDLPEKLRPIGRLDLMEDVAIKVDQYYSQMEKAEGESVDTLLGKVWVLTNQGMIASDKRRSDEAVAKYRAAAAVAEKAQRFDPHSDKALYSLATTQISIGGANDIRDGLQTLEKLVVRDPSNAPWQTQLAAGYDVEAERLRTQGQFDAALSDHRKAFAIRERLVAHAPNDSKRLSDLATSHREIGVVLFAQHQFNDALSEYRAAQEIFRKLTQVDPRNADWQRGLAGTYQNIGDMLQGQGQSAGALDQFRNYLQVMDTIAAVDPANVLWQQEANDAHRVIGDVLFKQNQFEKARTEYRKYHAGITKMALSHPTDSHMQVMAAYACTQLAFLNQALKEKGDANEASQAVQQGLAILTDLVARDPSNAVWQMQLAAGYDSQADLLGPGQFDAALSAYRKAYAIREKLVAQAPDDPTRLRELATSHSNIGELLFAQHQFNDALSEYRAGQQVLRKLTQIDPHNDGWQRALASIYRNIGATLQQQGESAGALDEFRNYSQVMDTIAAIDPANAVWQREADDAHCVIGQALFKQDQFEQARTEFRKCHAAITKLATGHSAATDVQVVTACTQLAIVNMVLKEKGDANEASQAVQQGLAILADLEKRDLLPPGADETRKNLEKLQRALPKPTP